MIKKVKETQMPQKVFLPQILSVYCSIIWAIGITLSTSFSNSSLMLRGHVF
jgi:hypothetical protein